MIDQVDIEASYKFYRARTEEADWVLGDYKVGMKPYKKIVGGFMKFLMKKVLEGNDVILGGKLGKIGVRGEKIAPIITESGEIRGIAPNWGETKKLQAKDEEARKNRTKVYCFNEHSNGIKYKFFWSKVNVIITNKNYYNLTFSRGNRRELSRLIQNGKEYLIKDKKL